MNAGTSSSGFYWDATAHWADHGSFAGTHTVRIVAQKPEAPDAPTLDAGNTQIAVSWTAPGDGGSAITGYKVQWAPVEGNDPNWALGGSADATGTSHTITNLANGTEYGVRVRAKNALGDGAWSNYTTATPSTVPAAPTGLSAAPGNAQVRLSWTAGSDGSSPITKHQYRRKEGGDPYGSWTDIPDSGAGGTNAASYTVTSLSNGTAYTFKVRAVNSEGEGAESLEVSATPSTVPAAPTGLSAAPGDAQVRLSWTAGSDGGSAVTKHQYQRKAGSDPYGNWTDIPDSGAGGANAASYTVTGLINGTAYIFRVRAVNSEGEGAESDGSDSVTPVGAPAAPTGLSATPGSSQVRLSWTVGSDGGSPITKHRYKQDSGGWEDIPDSGAGGANAASYTVTGLTNGTEYTFELRAMNSEGESTVSSKVRATPRAAAPTEPTGFSVTPGDGRVTLSWTAVYDGGSPVTKHQYLQKAGNAGTNLDWTDIPGSAAGGANVTSYTVTGLTNGTFYTFQVRAVNSVGVGPQSSSVSATPRAQAPGTPSDGTPDASRPSFPAEGRPESRSLAAGQSIAITLPGAEGGDGEFAYTLEPALPEGLAFNPRTREISGAPTAPQPPTEYTYTVTDGSGDTDTFTFTIEVTAGAPSPVGKPEVTAGDGRLRVSWTEPEDNGSPIGRYAVQWKTASGGEWTAAETEGTEYTIEGLMNGTEYAVRVRAANAVGEGPWSSEVLGKPLKSLLSSKALKVSLSAFARVAASGALEAVGERLRGSSGRSAHAALGGVSPDGYTSKRFPLHPAGRMIPVSGLDETGSGDSVRMDIPSVREVVGASEFELSSGEAKWSVWGRGRASGFKNGKGEVSADGEVLSGYLGVDVRPYSTALMGVAVSWNEGAMDYADGEDRGEMDISMGSIMPYVMWEPHERVGIWGMGGLGFGELRVRTEDGEREDADVGMRLVGAGMNYDLVRAGLDWDIRADAFAVEVDSQESPTLPESSGQAKRLRLALAGEGALRAGDGRRLVPGVELGLRYDDGDAGSGGGFEVGGGLGYEDENLGLVVETSARVLVAHGEDEFSEWGAGASLRYDPGIRNRGLMVSLAPEWGSVESGTERLWRDGGGLSGGGSGAGRFRGEVSYGVSGIAPFTVLQVEEGGHGVGAGVRVGGEGLDLHVEASREDSGVGPVDHGIRVRGALRF